MEKDAQQFASQSGIHDSKTRMMRRIAVYTCIVGDYDVLLPPADADNDVEFVLELEPN